MRPRPGATSALALGAATATVLALLATPAAAQSTTRPSGKGVTRPASSDIREVPPGSTYRLSKDLAAAKAAKARTSATAPAAAVSAATPPVGTVRGWLALDDFNGILYRKQYTLRGVGQHIEVWVASDSDATSTGTQFPAGDCRNGTPGSTDITDAQVAALVSEYDGNILPEESAAFSVAPDRDGSGALISGDFTGDGDKVVTLVDNVRDDNFYDFPAAPTYIAGFFSSQVNELLDRNVMTIDAYDWLHRTGANPPDDPTSDPCTSRPARPRLYEGVFAHEYQHLLEYYQDPNETTFINEGLSDFAISLTGYGDAKAPVFKKGTQSHIYCFQGFGTTKTAFNPNPIDCGGPENSLTLWGDEQTGSSILADYGNAWSFQLFLFDRYGQSFTSALHRDGAHQGLDGVQAELSAVQPGLSVWTVLHDFQTMNLLDRLIGTKYAANLHGIAASRVTSKSLNQALNLLNPDAYALPGAAPNGADYVALRGRGSTLMSGKDLNSLRFRGAQTLPALPLLWTVVTDAPGRAGNPTLWSGNRSNLDSAAVVQATVPTGDPTLTFTEKHLAESGFDYAYTMVSTDGGKTYTPLANANTVGGPLGPALNGDSDFGTQTFDLSAYAGKKVLLEFRYVSDGGVNEGGWYVDDIDVGGTTVSDGSSLDPFSSPTQVMPTQVANWSVRVVGYDETKHKALYMSFDGQRSFLLTPAQIAKLKKYPVIVVIVGYDDPTEQVQQFAPYTLKANSTVQAGGA
jgi:Immune inhibitor A peptidase M6